MSDQILFTPSSLLDFLLQIDELKDVPIGLDESEDHLSIVIGNSTYEINTSDAASIEVTEEVVNEVDDVNEEAYQNLEQTDQIDVQDTVESGLLKELVKSTLLGGLIRLTTKLIK